MTLGSYPAVSAKDAREAAKQQKDIGTGPVRARKVEKRSTVSDADTFKTTAMEWYTTYAMRCEDTSQSGRGQLHEPLKPDETGQLEVNAIDSFF